jgi:predicted aconitase with swiveling domain
MTEIRGRVVFDGEAEGPFLRLGAPISFWGGVDPELGTIADPRHPDHGAEITGRILAVPGTIGSSSSSAIMLELLRNGRAPAALILGQVDAILVLGIVVGRELSYKTVPVVEVAPEAAAAFRNGELVQVTSTGSVRTV